MAFVRLYTFYSPIAKGKNRLHDAVLRLCRYWPDGVETPAKDGRRFIADLTTGTATSLYFLGEYDRVLTSKFALLVHEGDTCIDVGANFGWYTSLICNLCGPAGAVHAFEPVAPTFQQLKRNYRLWGKPHNMILNELALGDRKQEITINLFRGLTAAHASISTRGRDDLLLYKCKMDTLDAYLESANVGHVDFIKVDVEGAELMFLEGASRLFTQSIPPIWLMEMALSETRNFGFIPDDLLAFFRGRGDYEFFAIDEYTGNVNKIEQFGPDSIGANVVCIPAAHYDSRRKSLTQS